MGVKLMVVSRCNCLSSKHFILHAEKIAKHFFYRVFLLSLCLSNIGQIDPVLDKNMHNSLNFSPRDVCFGNRNIITFTLAEL